MIDLEENRQSLLLFSFLLLVIAAVELKRKSRNPRRWRRRPINKERAEKNNIGGYRYFLKMKKYDPEEFFSWTRMSVPRYELLLSKIKQNIQKKPIKAGINPGQRLCITLRHLSQGDSVKSLAWSFQIGKSTVRKIILETCEAIWTNVGPEFLKTPNSQAEWEKIARDFYDQWNFPNCLGALDGKHIAIRAPPNSGSVFFNYKKYFSTVLLAICDSFYRFTIVDIGSLGSCSDGGIFKNCHFSEKLESGDLKLPPPTRPTDADFNMPFVFVADEAFPLKEYIFRPFGGKNLTHEQRIFNYRLSRARRTIENAFGILVARWRLLRQTIVADPKNVDIIVQACVVLHNYCMADKSNYCPQGYTDMRDEDNGKWRDEVGSLKSVGRLSANNAARHVRSIRDNLANYFCSEKGSVPWQDFHIAKGTQYQLPLD